jgi:aspartate-semialdehyde dehydrogenase
MSEKKFNVAVVGATGAVGKTVLAILQQRHFPVAQLFPLASARSVGAKIEFNAQEYRVADLAKFDFTGVDIAFFAAGGSVAAEYAPKVAVAGCIVIDKSSHFRYEEDVPLIVPEVNPDALGVYKNRNIIAVPNCSTIQMLVALKPIYDAVGIERINVCTYQAVAGTGVTGILELQTQVDQWSAGEPITNHVYPQQIAFNVLPCIDAFQENGYTKEEMKMVWETQKVFADKNILVNPTTVRVPVFYGHSEAVHIETKKKISASEVKKLLAHASGIRLISDAPNYPSALQAAGQDDVLVGRVREDISHPRGIDLWVVADNLRKGAALNAVQIAELLVEKYLAK